MKVLVINNLEGVERRITSACHGTMGCLYGHRRIWFPLFHLTWIHLCICLCQVPFFIGSFLSLLWENKVFLFKVFLFSYQHVVIFLHAWVLCLWWLRRNGLCNMDVFCCNGIRWWRAGEALSLITAPASVFTRYHMMLHNVAIATTRHPPLQTSLHPTPHKRVNTLIGMLIPSHHSYSFINVHILVIFLVFIYHIKYWNVTHLTRKVLSFLLLL